MGEITPIGKASSKACHRTVDEALEDARESHAREPSTRAVLVLAHIDDDGIHVECPCAGVDTMQALGLLELAKERLLNRSGG